MIEALYLKRQMELTSIESNKNIYSKEFNNWLGWFFSSRWLNEFEESNLNKWGEKMEKIKTKDLITNFEISLRFAEVQELTELKSQIAKEELEILCRKDFTKILQDCINKEIIAHNDRCGEIDRRERILNNGVEKTLNELIVEEEQGTLTRPVLWNSQAKGSKFSLQLFNDELHWMIKEVKAKKGVKANGV